MGIEINNRSGSQLNPLSICVFPVCPIPFRPFPSRPTFLPISPSAISPPTHFALYHFAPLPPRPIIFLSTYHFALLPIHPLLICPNAISPLYHFAPSLLRPMPFCPFIIPSLCFSFTETADYSTRFPGTEAQTVTWYRVRIQRILVYSFLKEL